MQYYLVTIEMNSSSLGRELLFRLRGGCRAGRPPFKNEYYMNVHCKNGLDPPGMVRRGQCTVICNAGAVDLHGDNGERFIKTGKCGAATNQVAALNFQKGWNVRPPAAPPVTDSRH